ncbi:MAG: TonB-dependent receptor [Prevotella sp.]|nr:TonB-dependent receptor [Prevotella sp.]
MKRLSMILMSLFLLVGGVVAQTTVKGTVVTYEDNEPIIGASIQVVGASNIGTITDVNGQFTLQVPAGKKTLKITYVGMEPLEVAVTDKPLRIQLRNDANNLDEVVVVAYGTQKKTSLTGSIQEVKSEAIDLRVTSSVASALEGTVTGVQVNSTLGQPGSDPSILIRGVGTVNGNSSPLYILDGVPFGGNISDLNPADIESMSVLKDAASAALYGNRASNGVILITTKKGKQGKLNITLDIKQGSYNRGVKEYETVNPFQFMESEWQNLRNNARLAGEDDAAAKLTASKTIFSDRLYLNIFDKDNDALFDANGKIVAGTSIKSGYQDDLDWFDQTITSGYRQEYNISANGANDKCDYLFSLGYLDENGYMKSSGFDRISARAALNVQPTKWFRAGLNLSGTHQNYYTSYSNGDTSIANPFYFSRYMSPIYPVHLHDINTGAYILDSYGETQWDGGSYVDADGQVQVTRNQLANRHVIWENNANVDKTVRNTLNGIAYADIILPYNFTLSLKGNLNLRSAVERSFDNSAIGDGQGNNGRAKRDEYQYKNYTFQQQLHWSHEYGVHSVDALIGHENYYYNSNYMYGYKTNEVFEGKAHMRNYTEITSLYDYDNNYRTESYLGRVRYGYDNRYNVEASFRRDGSSRFSKDARWGNFWSIGGNWVISNESFMKKYDWVNYLKLRADYGEVGNDSGSGLYGYWALYASVQNAQKGAYWISQLPNNDLKWETGQSWGIGIDGRLFNRLNFSLEYFDKRNKDLLFNVNLPLSAGATSTSPAEAVVTQNIGTISNKGVEFSFDVDVFKNRDWRINVGASITALKNEVVKLPEQNKDGIISGTKKIVEGKDRYSYWLYTWNGINTANGMSLYTFDDENYFCTIGDKTFGDKENGDEITDDKLAAIEVIDGVAYSYSTSYAKKEFHGSAMPKANGSFSLTASWKGLTLYTLFTYSLGGKVLDYNYAELMSVGTSPSNFHKDILNSWTYDQRTENNAIDPDGIPMISSSPKINGSVTASLNATSSRWLTSASYLIMKNINLTYQLPKALVRKVDLEHVAVTLACENVFTKTARRGMLPQMSFDGTQYNYLVTPRVFSVGLNVRF